MDLSIFQAHTIFNQNYSEALIKPEILEKDFLTFLNNKYNVKWNKLNDINQNILSEDFDKNLYLEGYYPEEDENIKNYQCNNCQENDKQTSCLKPETCGYYWTTWEELSEQETYEKLNELVNAKDSYYQFTASKIGDITRKNFIFNNNSIVHKVESLNKEFDLKYGALKFYTNVIYAIDQLNNEINVNIDDEQFLQIIKRTHNLNLEFNNKIDNSNFLDTLAIVSLRELILDEELCNKQDMKKIDSYLKNTDYFELIEEYELISEWNNNKTYSR